MCLCFSCLHTYTHTVARCCYIRVICKEYTCRLATGRCGRSPSQRVLRVSAEYVLAITYHFRLHSPSPVHLFGSCCRIEWCFNSRSCEQVKACSDAMTMVSVSRQSAGPSPLGLSLGRPPNLAEQTETEANIMASEPAQRQRGGPGRSPEVANSKTTDASFLPLLPHHIEPLRIILWLFSHLTSCLLMNRAIRNVWHRGIRHAQGCLTSVWKVCAPENS